MIHDDWSVSVAIAAKWWADKLRTAEFPSREYGNQMKTQDDLQLALMANIATSTKVFPIEQVDKFEQKLDRVIHLSLLFKWMWFDYWGRSEKFHFIFGTDYHPDKEIDIAAKYAGLPDLSMRLPWKTTMIVSAELVAVREGRGNPLVKIYPS